MTGVVQQLLAADHHHAVAAVLVGPEKQGNKLIFPP